MSFNNRLKTLREKRGMSQQELAEKSGVSRTTIVMLENNEAKVVKTDTLLKLAAAFGVPVTRIFFTKEV